MLVTADDVAFGLAHVSTFTVYLDDFSVRSTVLGCSVTKKSSRDWVTLK